MLTRVLLLCALLACAEVQAHGLYLAERHGELAVVIGYNSSDEAYPPERVTSATGWAADGTPRVVAIDRHARYASLNPTADTAVIQTHADYGFYARAEGPWKATRKSQDAGSREGLRALKSNLSIAASPHFPLHTQGTGLELIPLGDPLALHRGDTLDVQVRLDGKPLPGVRLLEDFLANDQRLSPPSDSSGKTRVTLHADRLNVIGLEYDQPRQADPDADFYRYFATLSFSLGHAEP